MMMKGLLFSLLASCQAVLIVQSSYAASDNLCNGTVLAVFVRQTSAACIPSACSAGADPTNREVVTCEADSSNLPPSVANSTTNLALSVTFANSGCAGNIGFAQGSGSNQCFEDVTGSANSFAKITCDGGGRATVSSGCATNACTTQCSTQSFATGTSLASAPCQASFRKVVCSWASFLSPLFVLSIALLPVLG